MKHFFILIFTFLFCLGMGQEALSALDWQGVWQEAQKALDKSSGGVSEKQEGVAGTSQLISCQTGVKDMPQIVTGLEVTLDNGWTLSQLHITATADSYETTVLPVFRTDLPPTEPWTDSYQGHLIFPIILDGESQEDITLNVQADWTVCPAEETEEVKCVTESHTYALPLSASESYRTTRCAALNRALITAAVDMSKTTTKAESRLLENGALKLRFTFPDAVKALEIRSEEPYHMRVLSIRPEDTVWTLVLDSDIPLAVGDTIPFSLRTTLGCYTANITVADNSLPLLPESLPFSRAFWTGIFFFLLSPAWSLWLTPQAIAKSSKGLANSIIKVRVALLLGVGGFGVLLLLNIFPSTWIQYTPVKWGCVIGLLYLLWRPIPNLWGIAPLICLLPKPFWEEIAYVSPTTKLFFLLGCALCCWIPFNVWGLGSSAVLKFFKSLAKQKVIAYRIAVRLPYLILIIWLAGTSLLQTVMTQAPVWEPTSEQKPALVKVREPLCLSCLRDDFFFFNTINPEVLPVYQIEANSPWAQTKKAEHGMRQNSFNLVITKTGAEVVLPLRLSQKNMKESLNMIFRD